MNILANIIELILLFFVYIYDWILLAIETFFLFIYFRISYERVAISANYLMERTKHRPKIAIICGSGLGNEYWITKLLGLLFWFLFILIQNLILIQQLGLLIYLKMRMYFLIPKFPIFQYRLFLVTNHECCLDYLITSPSCWCKDAFMPMRVMP